MEYVHPFPNFVKPQLKIIDQFPVTTAARTAKSGLAIGLAYGLTQDAVGALRGRKPAYVEFIQRRGRRKADTSDSEMA